MGDKHLVERMLAGEEEAFEDFFERHFPGLVAAQAACADTGRLPELLSIYHLFGDPAMPLQYQRTSRSRFLL